MKSNLALTAILIALNVAVGLLLVAVPNVEGISAISFFAGVILGAPRGALVGALSMLLFSLLNPLGPAPFPVFLAQVGGMAVIGSAGALWNRTALSPGRAGVLAAVWGGVLTFAYDIITNYGIAVTMGRWNAPLPVIASGIPFSIMHLVSNILIFAGIGSFVFHRRRTGRGGG
jgi:uncharacterized membrane protein